MGRVNEKPQAWGLCSLLRESEGKGLQEAPLLWYSPSHPALTGQECSKLGGGVRRAPRQNPEPWTTQLVVCPSPVLPGCVLTKAAVVVAGAVYRAVGENLQVKASSAVELAPPQYPFQVGEVRWRATLQLSLDLAQALIQETRRVS